MASPPLAAPAHPGPHPHVALRLASGYPGWPPLLFVSGFDALASLSAEPRNPPAWARRSEAFAAVRFGGVASRLAAGSAAAERRGSARPSAVGPGVGLLLPLFPRFFAHFCIFIANSLVIYLEFRNFAKFFTTFQYLWVNLPLIISR